MLDMDVEVIDDICDALAGSGFKKAAKFDFAYQLVVEGLDHVIMLAQDDERMAKVIDTAMKKAADAQKALEAFYRFIGETRGLKAYMNANVILLSKVAPSYSVQDVIAHFDEYQRCLKEIKTPARKKGRHNVIGSYVAEEIARQYRYYFKVKPATGKGRTLNSKKRDYPTRKTPYDLVCDVVAKHYGLKITPYMRDKAIKALAG